MTDRGRDRVHVVDEDEGAAGFDVAKGSTEVLTESGIAFDTLQWSNEAVADPSLAIRARTRPASTGHGLG